jgi:hypothetical protein
LRNSKRELQVMWTRVGIEIGQNYDVDVSAWKVNLSAVDDAFGSEIDYGQLVKVYGAPPANDTRYSPAQCLERLLAKSVETQIQSTFQRATLNARTSR